MEVSWQDLICLPDGEAVAALRKAWNWLLPEPWEPLLFSALGDVFLKQSSEEIFWLNCGTAELSRVAGNSGEFEAILGTAVADNWFMPDLIKELRFEGKIPSTGQCYTYAIFPIFSEGKYEAGNLNVVPWPELTKRPEFYSYGTNQERQAAFLLTSGIVLSGLNPTVFSDRSCCCPPQT